MSYTIVDDDLDGHDCLNIRAVIMSQQELKEFIEKLQQRVQEPESGEKK